MKKIIQVTAICLFAVSSFATVGCGGAEPAAAPASATSSEGGEAGSEAKPAGGSEAKAEGGSGSH